LIQMAHKSDFEKVSIAGEEKERKRRDGEENG
jgi:hypothetical protein